MPLFSKPSAVVLVHYHLKHGGVSRVIQNTTECLRKMGVPHLILCGSHAELPDYLPVEVLPELEYGDTEPDSAALVATMKELARKHLGKKPPIWHFHNHSLGKNRSIPAVVHALAEEGAALVLQYHDFAEEGRPENYRRLRGLAGFYPCSRRIRHVFLNSRDMGRMIACGLPAEQAVLLPNSSHLTAQVKSENGSTLRPLVLYPVRGIRRKNLGELFLLSTVAPTGTTFALTLAPEREPWVSIYEDWRSFGEKHRLPVALGVVGRLAPQPGADSTYESWISASTHFITTSVAEGFGLGFIEAAAHGKPLFGRSIPHLTDEFESHGIRIGRLYEKILVPVSWIGQERLQQRLRQALDHSLTLYGMPLSQGCLMATQKGMMEEDYVDFGNLPEDFQQLIIERILTEKSSEGILIKSGDSFYKLDAWLKATLAKTEPTVRPEQLDAFSQKNYAEKLTALYSEVAAEKPAAVEYLDPQFVLARFLRPGSFHFLCA
jgi:glycosyltransferase involved in cell wall biosynthesis